MTFTKHFLSPLNTVFINQWDGLKNNFTLLSFVKEPIGKDGIFKYGMMNYPFGDYVYVTDNTPLFSIPFRWFCHHIYDLSAYALPIFNFCIISNIIVCGLLVFYVFKRIIHNPTLSWISAVVLPWTNFQLPRIYRGHYNLSLTALCVFSIVLFLLWEKYYQHTTKRLLLLIGMTLFCYGCYLIHGYYIAIIPVFLSAMLLFFGVYKLFQKEKGWNSIISGTAIITLTGLFAYLTMVFTDQYFELRRNIAMGYDWMEGKTNFSLLFTHYSFHHFFFPIWSTKDANGTELMCYLGNIGLYSMLILFMISVFSRKFRILLWSVQKDLFKDPVKAGIIFAGLVLFSMSLGENYYPLKQPVQVSWPFDTNGSIPTGELIFMILAACLVAGILIRIIWNRKEKLIYNEYKITTKNKTGKAVLFYLSSAMILFAMFGHYYIGHWVNWTNPLWMAHHFTRMVEQFRSMVRFAWPFYWSFYIWIMFTVAAVYLKLNKNGRLLIIALLFLLGGSETIDFILEVKNSANNRGVLTAEALKPFDRLHLDFAKYQAILPIPYYNIGSEDYNNSIDDIGEWSKYSFQLSSYANLPLMSGKMARTPPKFAHLLLEMIIADSIPKAIWQKLNEKPILVAVNKKYLNDSTLNIIPDPKKKPNSNLAFWKSNDFVIRHSLQPIDSSDGIYFYRWNWKQ